MAQLLTAINSSLQDVNQRGAWPPLLCRAEAPGLCLEVQAGDFALRYQLPGKQAPEVLAFRSSVLAEIEGRTDTPVEIERIEPNKGRARFDDGGVPRTVHFDLVEPESVPAFPTVPKKFATMPKEFLHALQEAARTCASESGRLALARIQLRGEKGEVIATDGKQLLVQRGFSFPWSEDVLVSRVSAFGDRAVNEAEPVGVGRTEKHIAVRAGPWLCVLAVDAESRYPSVEVVIPRATSTTSRLHFDEADAAYLIDILPKLPGVDDTNSPVTLDLENGVAVRAKGEDQEVATEAPLHRSSASGPPVRLSLNRFFLRRALQMGLRDLQIVGSGKPVVFRTERCLYVIMTLDDNSVLAKARNVLRLPSSPAAESPSPIAINVDRVLKQDHFCAQERATFLSTFFRRKSPSQGAEGICGEKMLTVAPGAGPVHSAKVAPFESAVDTINRSNVIMSAPTPSRQPANGNGNGSSPNQPRCGLNELIDEAEQVRAVLQDASTRLGRLLTALKLQRRQSRVVQAAMASLKQLQLEP